MPFLQWNEAYKIDILEIDDQHRHCFELTNKLLVSIEDQLDHQTILNNFNALVDYTNKHFKFEEQLMLNCNYPNYHDHKYEHDSLLADIKQTITDLKQNPNLLSVQHMRKLHKWVTEHIITYDKKYTQFHNTST